MRRLILSFTALSLALALPYFAVRSQEQIKVGYAVLEVEGGQRPTAAALFSFTNAEGILVWEAGIQAAEEISRGRLFVDQSGQTRTAVALVNASDEAVEAELVLRDADGLEVDRKNELFAVGEHRSLFVDEIFDDPPQTGSLTFEALGGARLAAVTLRQNANLHEEAIFAALPVADLDAAPSQEPVVFPHIGTGGGLSTQIVLIDTSGAGSSGMISLTASDGEPLEVEVGGSMASEIPFQIGADGVFRTELAGTVGVRTGYAVVTVDEGGVLPDGVAIFQFRDGDAVITEAGVGAARGMARARMYVDNHRTQTGLALASPGNPAAGAGFTLLDRFSQPLSDTSRPIAEEGQLPIFADELFSEMPAGFTGLLEVEGEVPLAPISLKLTINARGDPVLTTLPVADVFSATEAQRTQRGQVVTRRLIFPQVGFGAGLATRLIVINPDEEAEGSATLSFRRTGTGEALDLPLGDRFGSDFDLPFGGVGGIDLRLGNTAPVAAILLDTFNTEFTEVVVDKGSSLQLRPRVIDSQGNPRDDFTLTFFNLDAQVADVSPEGFVTGLEKGFSTLRVTAGGVELQGLLTVVEVIRGVDIGETTGIVRDLAGRIYLSSETEHVIWRTDSIDSPPVLFAGFQGEAGLNNGERLQARFDRPRFLALNQATGDLYVADSGNHVIRVVRANGQVETLAGTGSPGSRDGPALQADFRSPQGIALDNRGHLWVSDSGNHTIRRIDLVSGQVETIAGFPGQSGPADGLGASARFDRPMGIALEGAFTDSLEGPQAVSLVIADSGNGTIRRIFEDGRVVTVGSGGENLSPLRGQSGRALRFRAPSGIAADTSGAIYLTESETGRAKVIESGGRVASLSQSQAGSKGVWASGGQALLSGMISYSSLRLGRPAIVSVDPESVRFEGGETVTIRGRNFTPDTFLVLGSQVLTNIEFQDSQTIVFTAPAGDTGLQTLSTLTRGGLVQHPLSVVPVPLEELEPGSITTVAGGASTFSGDGNAAVVAALHFPSGVVVDGAGNLFIADRENHRIRKVDSATGVITTVAGTGDAGFTGDGGPATAATLNSPEEVAVDRAGNLYVGDTLNNVVRRVDSATGLITTLAGSGERGFSCDQAHARETALNSPRGVALDWMGNLFVADTLNNVVRKVDLTTGLVTCVAGTGVDRFFGDDGPANEAALDSPTGVAVDRAGNLFIADRVNRRIRKVDMTTEVITTVAGSGPAGNHIGMECPPCPPEQGDGGPANKATLSSPTDVAVDGAGNLFIVDDRIRRVNAATGFIDTVAGRLCNNSFSESCFSGDGEAATEATLSPSAVTLDGAGNLFIADTGNHRIRRVDSATGVIDTVAGSGERIFLGDGLPATGALLNLPSGATVDGSGNLFIADTSNHRIRRVGLSGDITTIAGTGELCGSFTSQGCFPADEVPATESSLNSPMGVAVDGAGNLFIADTFNHRIRKVDAATGMITMVAGSGESGFSGDEDVATAAALDLPSDVAVDGAGNLFIADTRNNRIRRVDFATGIIITIAGAGAECGRLFEDCFSGDEGPAKEAALNSPEGVAIDEQGNLFIADRFNHRVRKVDRDTGIITTVAGSGPTGLSGGDVSGDGNLATLATLAYPAGVAVDGAGNLFIAGSDPFMPEGEQDEPIITSNHHIRRVDSATDVINTVAGTGEQGFSGDGDPAMAATLAFPVDVVVDGSGNLFIVDLANNRIRGVRGIAVPVIAVGIGPGN